MTTAQVQGVISEMVRRIVAGFAPDQVILFGSHARGDAKPGSDVDLAVVLPRLDGSILKKTVAIRGAVGGMGVSKDIIVLTTADLNEQKDLVGTIGHFLKNEGQVLYHKA